MGALVSNFDSCLKKNLSENDWKWNKFMLTFFCTDFYYLFLYTKLKLSIFFIKYKEVCCKIKMSIVY